VDTRANGVLVNHCWAAFQVGFAGVATVLLLILIVSVPYCSLGAPWPPEFQGSLIYNTMPGDVEVFMSRRGYTVVQNDWYRAGESIRVPRPAAGSFVIVSADRNLKFGDVLNALRAARTAGQKQVVLRTQLPPPPN
jgi:biopolymer transport protein ExbD